MASLKDTLGGVKSWMDQAGSIGPELRAKAEIVRNTARVINAKDGSPAPEPASKPSAPAKIDRVNSGAGTKYGSRPGESRSAAAGTASAVPVYHKGGKIKKTGIVRGKKGERVLSVAQTRKFEKKGGLKALSGE